MITINNKDQKRREEPEEKKTTVCQNELRGLCYLDSTEDYEFTKQFRITSFLLIYILFTIFVPLQGHVELP